MKIDRQNKYKQH